MESSIFHCKFQDPISNIFIKHQNPHQIPSKPIKPTTSLASPTPSQPPPTTTTHKTTDLHLSHLSKSGKLQEAIFALENGSTVAPRTYISLLQSCIDSDSIDQGRRLHASINSVRDPNPFIETKLVSMYAKCGSLEDARRVFTGMRERNLFTWSAMIGGCAREQRWEEVVDLFFQMMLEGLIPDCFLFPKVFQACGNIGDAETGRLLHSLAIRGGFVESSAEAHVSNSILAMYAKCDDLESAKRFFEKMGRKDRVTWNSIISGHCQLGENEEAIRLFEQMRAAGIEPGQVTWNILIASYNQSGKPELAMELMKQMESSGVTPDVFTWTSMISGFVQNNMTIQALDLFRDMQLSGVKPNGMTVASSISACTSLKSSKKGMELHSFAVKIGSASNVLVGNSLVDMYAKCGRLEDAQRVFDEISERDVFTWNSMIGGYARAGYCGKAYEIFSKMEDSGIRQNVVTWNVMISGHIQNGDEDQAMELFQRMETDGVGRNTASWNALIAGFLQNGQANKALRIFRQMQSISERPNSVTILSILPACANLVSAWKVREIHACILHSGLQSDIAILNSLIDTYSKSGDITSSRAVFDGLPSRDLISWNSIIAGCVLHGCSQIAQDIFHQMKQEGVKPNAATFSSMINAYSLLGMVKEGEELFSSMIKDYQLSPGLEHYAAMVDLLGRSGRLREASDFIEKMPIEPNSAVWIAFLTAARIYGNLRLANLAAGHLINLEPKNSNIHRLVLHLHALTGKFKEPSRARKPKKGREVDDAHGCCWIEVKNKVHTFLTGDRPTEESEFKYAELDGMAEEIRTAMPDFSNTKLDIEEEKGEIAGTHSEELAIAYALVNSPTFRNIRIIKSVRMCTKCHTTAKVISKVYERDILLKDPKSFHHFRDGNCSCGEYW